VTPLSDAQAHLAKAAEFLASAEENLAAERFNAATSDAVISGINAKDAICLKLVGNTAKTENHQTATAELRGAGRVGASAAVTLGRLLSKKTQSQDQTSPISKTDADRALKHARALYRAPERLSPRRRREPEHRDRARPLPNRYPLAGPWLSDSILLGTWWCRRSSPLRPKTVAACQIPSQVITARGRQIHNPREWWADPGGRHRLVRGRRHRHDRGRAAGAPAGGRGIGDLTGPGGVPVDHTWVIVHDQRGGDRHGHRA
jgi:hypothetical protein